MFKLGICILRKYRLGQRQFLILLILFAVSSVYLSNNLFVKDYLINIDTQQSFENLQPELRSNEVKATTSTNGLCGTPVTIYEGVENCEGGGTAPVDFGRNNGGKALGSTAAYSTLLH